MKELLLRITRYNVWANARFIDILRSLDDERLNRQMISSFPTISDTVLHMWGAEDIWLQRLHLVPSPVWQVPIFKGDIHELCDRWELSSSDLVQFVENAGDESFFKGVIQVTTLKGVQYNDEISMILQHVCNHATYHRGQLVTMLRQVGITEIPSTDLFALSRML